MATIKDVARIAGVSVSTVSHVVNGTRYVSPEKVRKVEDAIRQLDELPNFIAKRSALKSKLSESRYVLILLSKKRSLFQNQVKEKLEEILKRDMPADEKAIALCLYCMKAQIFTDGNKRASVIFANHYLISRGGGMLIIPEKEVPEFKKMLVAYYEDRDRGIAEFMKDRCIKKF